MATLFDKNTLKLLRIPFSYFLMPVFFFGLSQCERINWLHAITAFLVLHLFIYPASNGYNSYMDQDEGSIGGLKNPPKPTKNLFYASLVFDVLGLLLSLLIGWQFMVAVLLYILASRAYSFKGIRLKKFPIIGFLTVIVFQGAYTFWMVYQFVSTEPQPIVEIKYLLLGASFLIAGVFPLTQIYQHEEDAAAGDYTISYRLGFTGTFLFTAAMFVVANMLILLHFMGNEQLSLFYIFQGFLFPVVAYFGYWFVKVLKDNTQANFENTMRMNALASTCMNLCFTTFVILKYI